MTAEIGAAVTVDITAAGAGTIVMVAEDHLAEAAKPVRKDPDQAIGIAGNAGITSLPGIWSAGCVAHPSQNRLTEAAETKTVEAETQTAAAEMIRTMHAATTVAVDAVETRRGGLIVVTIAVDWDPRGVRKKRGATVTQPALAPRRYLGLPGRRRRKLPEARTER